METAIASGTPAAPGADLDRDRRCAQRVLDGDTAAYAALIKRHEGTLRRIVSGILADRHAADDVLQEVFWIAYRRLETFAAQGTFEGWIVKIAVREALRLRLRVRALRRVLEPLKRAVVDAGDSRPAADEVGAALEILEQLPARERAAFVLHVVEDRSYQEIAELLSCPIGTVGSLISRGRARLKELGARRERQREHLGTLITLHPEPVALRGERS